MKIKVVVIATALPLALMLSACTTVEPAFQDIGNRTLPCIDGGPDTVAQKFYDLRIGQQASGLPGDNQLAEYSPYLSTSLYNKLLQNNTLLRTQGQSNLDITATPNEKSGVRQGDIFSSQLQGPTSVKVSSASSIPNTDARNIPLRVSMVNKSDKNQKSAWNDEVLMIREGQCWTIDDVRYVANLDYVSSGSLRQVLEKTP